MPGEFKYHMCSWHVLELFYNVLDHNQKKISFQIEWLRLKVTIATFKVNHTKGIPSHTILFSIV